MRAHARAASQPACPAPTTMTSYLRGIAIIVAPGILPFEKFKTVKALVIGGGGREHAIAWKLSQSKRFQEVVATPGNPGIAQIATCIKPRSDEPPAYLELAREVGAELTVVGPEAPLVAGVVDLFREQGLRIIGPTAQAARLEGSKAFSKAFMLRTGVPTAQAIIINTAAEAIPHLGRFGFPVVLKADGLAAGKGVVIAQDHAEACAALAKLPPGKIVIEEFLAGEEVSYIVLADGERFQPMAPTQDHKAVWDNDQGPNTGGMGAYCDGRILTKEQDEEIIDIVIRPSLRQMVVEGTPYTGFLYAGLMMTAQGPKVLEFNTRLGDPETQVIIHRMASDFGDVLLDGASMEWKPDPSVCVVMAARGYPGEVRTGDAIAGTEMCGATVFHAGTRMGAKGLETAGGRVLGVTASGPDLTSAIDNTYRAVKKVHFDGMHYRRDIGRKGLKRW